MSGWGVKTRNTTYDGFATVAANPDRHMPGSLGTATKRAHKMANQSLFEWADTNLSEIGRLLLAHGHEPGTGDALREAEHAAAALYACIAELASRQPVPPPGTPSAETLRRMGSALHG